MTETTPRYEIKVGVFVGLGVMVLLVSILLFGGDQMWFTSTYRLKAQFPEVQGLAPGSVVSLSGLPIGNVKEIRFVPEGSQVEVGMDINEEFSERITSGSLASVRTQGALGDRYIYIEPGPASAEALEPGSYIKVETSAGLIEVISEKGEEFARVTEVIKEVHELLKSLNEGNRSAALMENLVASSQNLNQLMIESRQTLKEIRGSSEKDNKLRQSLTRLASILEKVDKGEGTLGALVNDPSLHQKLMSLLGESPRNAYLKPLIRATIQENEKKEE